MVKNCATRIVLPDKHEIVAKLIMSTHEELSHLGPVATIAKLYDKFWIFTATQYANMVLSKCLACIYQKAKCQNPPMATLPDIRLKTNTVPFVDIGMDVAGPFKIIKESRKYPQKTWILIINCVVTRACKLMILDNITTEDFLTVFSIFFHDHNKVTENFFVTTVQIP